MALWYYDIMASWYHDIMAWWYHVIMESWDLGIMESRDHEIMRSWDHGIMGSWDHGIIASWHHDIMASWHRGNIFSFSAFFVYLLQLLFTCCNLLTLVGSFVHLFHFACFNFWLFAATLNDSLGLQVSLSRTKVANILYYISNVIGKHDQLWILNLLRKNRDSPRACKDGEKSNTHYNPSTNSHLDRARQIWTILFVLY